MLERNWFIHKVYITNIYIFSPELKLHRWMWFFILLFVEVEGWIYLIWKQINNMCKKTVNKIASIEKWAFICLFALNNNSKIAKLWVFINRIHNQSFKVNRNKNSSKNFLENNRSKLLRLPKNDNFLIIFCKILTEISFVDFSIFQVSL